MQMAVNTYEIQSLIDNQMDSRNAAITYGKVMMDDASTLLYNQMKAQKDLLVRWYQECVAVH